MEVAPGEGGGGINMDGGDIGDTPGARGFGPGGGGGGGDGPGTGPGAGDPPPVISAGAIEAAERTQLAKVEDQLDNTSGAAESESSLDALASAIREAGLHPAARNNRTFAVGVDSEGHLFAGSSNGFDAGQRAMLKRLDIARVPGTVRFMPRKSYCAVSPNSSVSEHRFVHHVDLRSMTVHFS